MDEVKVRCKAERGIFEDEWVVEIPTVNGARMFFVDDSTLKYDNTHKELIFSSLATASVVTKGEDRYLISIYGEPADLNPSRIWVNKEQLDVNAQEEDQ